MGRADSQLLDKMIFLVGAPRSGTNWLQRMIGAHPDIAVVPTETYLFSNGVEPLAARFQHAAPTSVSLGAVYIERNEFLDGLRDLCDRAFVGVLDALKAGATRLCERTPEHAKHVRLIGDVYPDARFVHIIRDGRDTARSLASQEWGPQTIAAAAAEWVECVSRAREDGQRLRHYSEVRYEELLADPRDGMTRLYEWLGVDATRTAVEAALTEADVLWNVDPAAPTVAVGKWRDSFSQSDLNDFLAVGGPLLSELGYPDAAVVAPTRPAQAADDAAKVAPRGLKDLARSLMRRAGGTRPFPLELRARNRDIQLMIDRILTAIAEARPEDIRALASDTTAYRVVDGAEDHQARGAEGFELFADALRRDPALGGRQTRGDVHLGVPSGTVILAYRGGDGTVHHRALVVTYQGDAVTRICWYQHRG